MKVEVQAIDPVLPDVTITISGTEAQRLRSLLNWLEDDDVGNGLWSALGNAGVQHDEKTESRLGAARPAFTIRLRDNDA
jgi:hypothetical protein